MSALICCVLRGHTERVRLSCHLVKRCSLSRWKSGSTLLTFRNCGKPTVYTIQNRTLIRKRQLIGGDKSVVTKSEYKKDKIDPEFRFVYSTSGARVYMWWTPVALVLVVTVLSLCGWLVIDDFMAEKPREKIKVDQFMKIEVDDIDPLAMSLFIIPVALIALVIMLNVYRDVLLRLYYNRSTNEFIAVMLKYGVYKTKMHFKPSDVRNLENIKIRGNILIKGKPVIVVESSFTDIAAYNILMGYNVARPGAQQEQNINLTQAIHTIKKQKEKKDTEVFVKNYLEKRKLNQKKNT